MTHKTKILIVDDEEDFCFFVRENLINTGEFDVVVATNGHRGIELAGTEHPDLILLDLMMPDMSGEEVAEVLHNAPGTDAIPIIFLTALVTRDEAEDEGVLKKIGDAHFIAKPVRTWELIAAIKIVLKKARENDSN